MTVKKPPVAGAPICLDHTTVAEAEAARQTLQERSMYLLETFIKRADNEAAVTGEDLHEVRKRLYEQDQTELEDLAQKAKDTQTALAAATRIYTFRSLGYKAWRAMKNAHPSKSPEKAFDEDSIAATLLREASLDPKLSAEMVEEILTSPDWSEGEVRLLLDAAVRAQS